jgi:transcriptional regulator with XRE-family HTH domain
MASNPNVLPIFAEPDGKNSAAVIASAIRKTKAGKELNNSELAFELRCDPSTIENIEAERNLPRFDLVARLLRKYPQYCAGIRQLWELDPVEQLSPIERIERAERELMRARQDLQATIERRPELAGDIVFPFREGEQG